MSARAILAAGGIGVAAIAAPMLHPTAPRLLWNASASAPIGLYRVHPIVRLQRGMMVAIQPPDGVARLAASRHYLPLGHPLLKTIVAVEGDLVCRAGSEISVDGQRLGRAHARDHLGRPLPRWQGCAWLGPGDLFVMNVGVPDSFDGRYFGVLSTASIVGRVTPIWLRRAPPHPPHA